MNNRADQEAILKHFQAVDKAFYQLVKKAGSQVWQIEDPADELEKRLRLYRIIIGQQVSAASARALWGRLGVLLREDILIEKPERLRAAGLSRPKLAYLQGLRELDFKALDAMNQAELSQCLLKYKGIGPWTVEMALLFIYRQPDVFSWSDLALKNSAAKFYHLDPQKDLELLKRKIDRFKPYRSVAALALWHHLEN